VTEYSLVNELLESLKFINKSKCIYNVVEAKNQQLFEGMNHLSNFAFLRVFASDYFDVNIKKVIYFDVDCWVRKDLSHLFEIDLKSQLAGGVMEYISANDKVRLGLFEEDYYINTGFLLINLFQWREENIQEKFVDCYLEIKEKLIWADQDVFNVLFRGRWLLMDSEYNLMRQFQFQPKIVHFNTGSKPWHFEDQNHWTREYANGRMLYDQNWIPEKFNFNVFVKFIMKSSKEFYQHIRFAIKCLCRYLFKISKY
jgi:lipopolysaccharide biosynthesis glycosyltransferase